MLDRRDDKQPTAVPTKTCVLVVEDEDLVRDLAERVLALHGYDVIGARDGAQAVTVFSANASRIDLVLLDLTMPGMSGAEVFAAIENIHPVKVLLTSGYSEEDSVELMRHPQVVGFLAKPYRVDRLIERVEQAIAHAPN